jgi:regulatory protein
VVNESAGAACYDKAVELLARRPHFRLELRRKLEQRGFGFDAVRDALERLQDLGYLDDALLARQWASGELRRRGYGPRRIRAELRRRGVEGSDLERALEEAFAEGELNAAREAARRWRRRGGGSPDALARHLNGKGFSQGAILTVLERQSDRLD